MNLKELTVKSLHNGLVKKEFSAREVTYGFLDTIRAEDGEIGAYLSVLEDGALEQADRVDAMIKDGKEISLLSGVPLAIKDNMLIKGTRTTAASKILEYYEASYDATVIEKLKKENVVFLGKTNLDEFAMGASTENSGFHVTKNPHDTERVAGGSSGGSVAAVAAHMALAALGSDTGGSIRQPSAFCGVVGMKPTYSAVSRSGLIAMASSLDQIGPITKTVEDAEILFDVIKGKDKYDATSAEDEVIHRFRERAPEDVKKLKIGIPKEYFIDGMDNRVAHAVEEAIARLKTLGFTFEEISLPHAKYALAVYYIIMPAEVSANLARFEGVRYPGIPEVENEVNSLKDLYFKTRGTGFGAEPRRRILLGTYVLSAGYYDAYYAKAQKVRRLIRNDFEDAFRKVDVILAPVAPTPAFKIGEKASNPLEMYLSDIFTVQASLAGLPGISIPVKEYVMGSGELPIGFQLMGKPFHEADLFGIGKLYQKEG